MALLGYQKWKAEKVESGECRQTIRARRKKPVKVGEKLYHYTGLRTKKARKILESVCTETFVLQATTMTIGGKLKYVWMDFDRASMQSIALKDGFESIEAMTLWFMKNHPIKNGNIATLDVIRW